MTACVLLALAFLATVLRPAHADVGLVRAAVGGDRGALTRLARRLMPTIVSRVRFHLRGGVAWGRDRDDIAQDVWLTLLSDEGRQLLAWDPERGRTLEGYVGLLTRRVLWQTRRDGGRLKRGGELAHAEYDDQLDGDPDAPDPERTAGSRMELTRVVEHMRAELPPRGRVVFELLYGDQLSPKEAARALGVNLQVVYNWQHRIRTEARALLA